MLDPQILAQHKESILKIASANHIQAVKVFGKHIGQQFELQAGINFIIIPGKKMTSWHKRNFELTVDGLLSATLEVFTPKDLNDLAKDEIITAEQVNDSQEKAVTLEDFLNARAKENTNLPDPDMDLPQILTKMHKH